MGHKIFVQRSHICIKKRLNYIHFFPSFYFTSPSIRCISVAFDNVALSLSPPDFSISNPNESYVIMLSGVYASLVHSNHQRFIWFISNEIIWIYRYQSSQTFINFGTVEEQTKWNLCPNWNRHRTEGKEYLSIHNIEPKKEEGNKKQTM